MNMKTDSTRLIRFLALSLGLITGTSRAQFNIDGEFRTRWYGDSFSHTADERGPENYMRYFGRIHGRTKVGEHAAFSTELVAMTDNPASPVRNIAGTGYMRYGISEIYAEVTQPDFLIFDVARLRAGRQQFPIGNGLSLGDSYNPNRFDGGRIDLARDIFTLSLFGSITGQNLSSSGLYPDPGSDQLYVARLGASVFKQDVMAYYLLQKLRGNYNDSYIIGGGSAGTAFIDKLEYFCEVAYQKFNVPPGLPKKSGVGYMGGASYQWTLGPFRSMKFESRYAAYQGDDASTPDRFEQFSPMYASFFWGARAGYVDGDIGGDLPHNGLNVEGCRFTRFYVIPRIVPKLRVQVQFVKVDEFVNNDGVNSMDNEFAVRGYYTLSSQVQFQFRFARTFPNDDDADLNHNGIISSTEDRYNTTSFMMEIELKF